MDNKSVFKFWDTLPTWAKGVIAVGGLGASYFAIRSFINKIKSDAAKKDQIVTQKNQEAELQNNIDNGIVPTYQPSQYRQWADEIQTQFDGCDFGIRVPVSPTILWNQNWSSSGAKLATIVQQFKNDADFLSLSTAWGVSRVYDQCGYTFGITSGNFEGNLAAAVTDELDQQEINAINDYLAQQNITYRF